MLEKYIKGSALILLGKDRFSTEEPVLHGDCVYRYVYVFDENGNQKTTYLQTMKLSDKEWKCISTSDFEIEGKRYAGFNYPFFAESEDIRGRLQQYIAYNPMDELNGVGTSVLGYAANFPVHMGAYEALMEEAVDEDRPEIWYTNYGVKYEDVPYTEEQVEQFYFLLENAQPAKFYGTSIYSMVSEELAPYFAGDVTAEQAAEKLNNRVQLYLDESK